MCVRVIDWLLADLLFREILARRVVWYLWWLDDGWVTERNEVQERMDDGCLSRCSDVEISEFPVWLPR